MTLLLAGASVASADDGVSINGTINGTDIASATESHPLKLDPTQPVALDVTVRNDSGTGIVGHTIRLEGRVAGLTFFSYDTTVDLAVAEHRSETLKLTLDLAGLDGQATGLIPSHLVLLDSDRHTLASQAFVADVQGSLASVYGLFGLAIFVMTGVSLAGALLALARGRLHRNRWRRGLRFLVPGIGVGLLLVFSLSAFRVLTPQPSRSIPCIVVSAIVFFVLGYLTPNPTTAEDDEDDDIDGELEPIPVEPVTVEPVQPVAVETLEPAVVETVEPVAAETVEPVAVEAVEHMPPADDAPVVPEWPVADAAPESVPVPAPATLPPPTADSPS